MTLIMKSQKTDVFLVTLVGLLVTKCCKKSFLADNILLKTKRWSSRPKLSHNTSRKICSQNLVNKIKMVLNNVTLTCARLSKVQRTQLSRFFSKSKTIKYF